MNLPFFLASRINKDHTATRKVSRPAIKIGMWGVAIGLAVMIISVCVVIGFKHTIRDKVIGFGSHITVSEFVSMQENANQPVCMDDSTLQRLKSIPGIAHVQRFAMKQGILKTDEDFLGVMFKGVGPEFDSTFIATNMVEGHMPTFSDTVSTNQLVISRLMADKLRVKAGDRIFAYFLGNDDVRTRRFTIAGIYATNLRHFDESICLVDLYSTVKLNGWETDQASGAELTLNDFDALDLVARDVTREIDRTQDRYGNTYTSRTVTAANPQIFSWLDLLDLNVWIILGLMVAVAAFTMISGLLIIILERTQMIGLLRLHHRQGSHHRQHHRSRSLSAATFHWRGETRRRSVLCRNCSRGDQHSPYPFAQHRHPTTKRARVDWSKLPHFAHPSIEVDAVRVRYSICLLKTSHRSFTI